MRPRVVNYNCKVLYKIDHWSPFFQSSRLVVHVVLEPDQVDSVHHLAQLQVDHHQGPPLARARLLPRPVLLFVARIFCEEIDGSLIRN